MTFSKQFLVTIAIVVVILPSVAVAMDYVVGDDAGWTIRFNYADWAKDKIFVVGDKLIFKYQAGQHNVFKVNGTAFAACVIRPVSEALVTRNEVIALATTGRKWYFCGAGEHCAKGGQKLVITVMPYGTEVLAPAPSAANGVLASAFQVLISVVASIAAMIMI